MEVFKLFQSRTGDWKGFTTLPRAAIPLA